MITNWDLVSRIEQETGNTHFSLLIDGTENDARIIAKKLAGVAKEPVPAQSPFVYAFELPDNLDEATQDKIRTAMREGVEMANKVSQFVPGGMLGDPLFNHETAQNNSEQSQEGILPELVLPAHQDGVETFTSYIPATDKEAVNDETSSQEHILSPDTLPEMVLPAHEEGEPTFTSFIPATQMGDIHSFYEDTQENAEEISTQEASADNEAAVQDAPASLEEVFADPYASAPTQNEETPNSAAAPQTEVPPVQKQETPLPQTQEEASSGMPLDDKDMLIKDMEGTVLDRMPIDDIFAAETKYDMFVDVANKVKAQHAQQQRENKLNEATAQPDPSLDIFAQNFKEQTSVIDMTALQKALDQLPTTAQPSAEIPGVELESQTVEVSSQEPEKQPEPQEGIQQEPTPKAQKSEPEQPAPQTVQQPAEQPAPQEEKLEEPVPEPKAEKEPEPAPEATAATQKEPASEKGLHTVLGSKPIDDTLPEITLRQPTPLDLSEMQAEASPSVQTPQQKTDIPVAAPLSAAAAIPAVTKVVKKLRRKEPMEEKTQKTFFKLKLKKPSAKAPVPPVPSKPKPAAPGTPVPPKPEASEAEDIVASQKGGAPVKTVLERTKTIDHSIQVSLSELKKHNWPLEVPLVPTYTLSNMVMSVNRFAHATAISVIESPGKLYNPLVLHGPTGTGKSHFLNAMAYAFSQKFGQANIFMTNGVRLSRGIQRYIMEGNIEKFDQFMSTVKVLLIDDIHLLAINEQNRAYISKLLNTFLKEQKQIVITSKYPPESLEKLEELIKFRLDSGWISELKSPTGQVQFKITKKMLLDNHVDLSDSQIKDFFSAENMTLGTVQRSIRRLKVLENLLPANLSPQQRSAGAILEKLLASQGEDETSHILTVDPSTITSISALGNGEWGRIGFFYPANCSDKMNWMVYSLQERAKELGIEGGPEIVVRSSYATENIISSAFKIANLCDNKKLKGAVILGPKPGTYDPSVRENFYDILTHMLEVMLIRCGIINFESVRQPSMYVKVLAELMR